MGWHAIVFWKSAGSGPLGWHWRLSNADLGVEEGAAADSVEQAMAAIRDVLRRHGTPHESVPVEIWDEGVWEKC